MHTGRVVEADERGESGETASRSASISELGQRVTSRSRSVQGDSVIFFLFQDPQLKAYMRRWSLKEAMLRGWSAVILVSDQLGITMWMSS
jgi:hypothetical protein